MKVLMLDAGYDLMSDYFREYRNKVKYCHSECLYKKTKNRGLFYKLIQFVGIYLFSPILFLVYGNWKKEIEKYDIFILTSRRSSKYAVQYISKYCNKKKKRLIVWYWNVVSGEEMNPEWCRKYNAELWTFDQGDAKKFNMHYNNTYYFSELKKDDNYNYSDIFYVGLEKEGRYEILQWLQKECDRNKLITDFNVVKNSNYKGNNKINYIESMDYFEVLKRISGTKCILDINNSNQIGLTLRPLESIFFEKKLITNNKNIRNFDFYNKNNIFIIGVDKIEKLKYFIELKYNEIDRKIMHKYTFENWLDRIVSYKK